VASTLARFARFTSHFYLFRLVPVLSRFHPAEKPLSVRYSLAGESAISSIPAGLILRRRLKPLLLWAPRAIKPKR
jgi:hypothetical protein